MSSKSSQKDKVCIDTNIILRALMGENSLFFDLLEESLEAHIPLPIFFETIYVLEKFYKKTRSFIFDCLSTTLSYVSVRTEKDLLKQILDLYINTPSLSVIDCYLLAYSKENDLSLCTLDKDLEKKIN